MRGHRPSRAHYAITKKKAQKIEFPSLSFSISLRRINRQHGANPCSSCSRFDLVMVVCTCEAVILEIVVGKYPNRSVHEGPKDREIEKKRKRRNFLTTQKVHSAAPTRFGRHLEP